MCVFSPPGSSQRKTPTAIALSPEGLSYVQPLSSLNSQKRQLCSMRPTDREERNWKLPPLALSRNSTRTMLRLSDMCPAPTSRSTYYTYSTRPSQEDLNYSRSLSLSHKTSRKVLRLRSHAPLLPRSRPICNRFSTRPTKKSQTRRLGRRVATARRRRAAPRTRQRPWVTCSAASSAGGRSRMVL